MKFTTKQRTSTPLSVTVTLDVIVSSTRYMISVALIHNALSELEVPGLSHQRGIRRVPGISTLNLWKINTCL